MARARNSKSIIIATAERIGLTIETNSPGDGVRRYEFAIVDKKKGTYHVVGAAYGAREAEVFLNGYKAGRTEYEHELLKKLPGGIETTAKSDYLG